MTFGLGVVIVKRRSIFRLFRILDGEQKIGFLRWAAQILGSLSIESSKARTVLTLTVKLVVRLHAQEFWNKRSQRSTPRVS